MWPEPLDQDNLIIDQLEKDHRIRTNGTGKSWNLDLEDHWAIGLLDQDNHRVSRSGEQFYQDDNHTRKMIEAGWPVDQDNHWIRRSIGPIKHWGSLNIWTIGAGELSDQRGQENYRNRGSIGPRVPCLYYRTRMTIGSGGLLDHTDNLPDSML